MIQVLAPQGRGVKSGIAWGRGTLYPNTMLRRGASRLGEAPRSPGASEDPANSRKPLHLCPPVQVADSGTRCTVPTHSGARCDRGPSYCCKPVWLPCRACGMEQGVERKGEEPGRPAGGACSLPESRPPRSLLAASLARTPARRAGTRGRRVLPLLGLHPRSRLALPPAAAGSWWSACYSAGERSGGKEGERGDTHTGRGARALHTRSRASPSPRVRAECGPAAGPGTCRLRRCPGSAPPAARRSHQGTRDIPTTCPPWRNWSWPPKLQHAGRGR